jgi:uncharacterized protein
LNYLCAGYKAFFTHIDRPMRLMVQLLKQGRYADEVMALLANQAGAGKPQNRTKPVGFQPRKVTHGH